MFEIIKTKSNLNNAMYDLKDRLQYGMFKKQMYFCCLGLFKSYTRLSQFLNICYVFLYFFKNPVGSHYFT